MVIMRVLSGQRLTAREVPPAAEEQGNEIGLLSRSGVVSHNSHWPFSTLRSNSAPAKSTGACGGPDDGLNQAATAISARRVTGFFSWLADADACVCHRRPRP